MFRQLLTIVLGTSSIFASVSAFGLGPACEGIHMQAAGNCVKKSDCTTNEWLYGQASDPVCDVVGSDSALSTTKVCCFDTPDHTDIIRKKEFEHVQLDGLKNEFRPL